MKTQKFAYATLEKGNKMNNNVSKVGELAIEIFKFDHTYYFSDDFRVWSSGENVKKKLIDKATTMNLSIQDKLFMISVFQSLWDENYENDFSSINSEHIHWPYKSSMYQIAGITKDILQYSPIQ